MQNLKLSKKIHGFSATFLLAAAVALLTGCGDGGIVPGTTTVTAVTGTAATLQLSATSTSIPSDNSSSTTITVTALDGSNAALTGIVVSLAADTGIVSAPTVTTGTGGTATFTFRSGTASSANRTATITARAGASAQIPIQISGSTLSVFTTSGTSVPNDGTLPVTITFIAKNAVGTGLPGVAYTASWATGTGGQLTITPTSGTTDTLGKFVITVAGAAANGTATVSATAAGSSASQVITVSAVAGTFGITQTSNSTGPVVTTNPTSVPMKIGDNLTVTVAAPAAATTSVRFTTSMGTWSVSGTTTQTVTVVAGVASAVLLQTTAGVANVQVDDPLNTSLVDTLSVGITATTAASITLTASPSVVAKSVGTTTGASTLIAKVVDSVGNPVGNAAIAFSMTDTTGGGESVSPVVAYTTSVTGGGLGLGEARATFTSGSLSSINTGVKIRASVLGTTVATEVTGANITPSGNDAAVVIGGTAGSIAFGIATEILVLNSTTYQLPMSVLVADAAGNAVANTVVNLSTWPHAWSTGAQPALCAVDSDTATTGTFLNEDINGNLILDPGEDGVRTYLAGGSVAGGSVNGSLTPINSAAGTLPSSVTTDANGVASFNLTYLKTSAIWTVDRIRATTVTQGTESVSQIVFRLPAAVADVGTTSLTCKLSSPYTF